MGFFDQFLPIDGYSIMDTFKDIGDLSFDVPDNVFKQTNDFGNWFSQNQQWTRDASRGLASQFNQDYSASLSDISKSVTSGAGTGSGLADGMASMAKQVGDFIKSDTGRAMLGYGAAAWYQAREAEKDRKQQEQNIKLQKRHLGAYYV